MAKRRTPKKRTAREKGAEIDIDLSNLNVSHRVSMTLTDAMQRLETFLKDVSQSMGDARQIIDECEEDSAEAEKLMDGGNSQFARRTIVRTAFARIEATSCVLRRFARLSLLIQACKSLKLDLTTLELLTDAEAVLSNTGKTTLQRRRQPMVHHLAFTLRALAEVAEEDADKFFHDNGWSEFQKAVRIRHRLTHPKTSADLHVTDADLRSFRKAGEWFFDIANELSDVFAQKISATRSLMGKIRSLLGILNKSTKITIT